MKLTNKKTPIYLTLGICLFLLPFIYFKHAYLYTNFTFWLGLFFSPFIFQLTPTEQSKKYFFPALALGILLCFIRSSTAYYFLFAFSILFLIEGFKGKLNYLPIYLFVVISPIFQNVANIWSFPIRLKLSELTAKSLNFLGMQAEAVGNIIYLDGNPFSVDPECTGLKMVSTSLILGLLILAFFEKKYRQNFNFLWAGAGLGLVISLAVLANFTRLLALVIFTVLPENPMHDVIGMLSLIVYVVFPFYFMINYLCRWNWAFPSNKIAQQTSAGLVEFPKKTLALSLFLLSILLFHGPQFLKEKPIDHQLFQHIEFPDFERSITENGILKLENSSTLIYIKPPIRPFQGSHDPRICWQGSGYKFLNIHPTTIDGIEVYTALLVEKQDTLYTAWWYDNGTTKTISEWDWRWESLKGNGGFYLINVNCETVETLQCNVSSTILN